LQKFLFLFYVFVYGYSKKWFVYGYSKNWLVHSFRLTDGKLLVIYMFIFLSQTTFLMFFVLICKLLSSV
jgi:hypothetical protein